MWRSAPKTCTRMAIEARMRLFSSPSYLFVHICIPGSRHRRGFIYAQDKSAESSNEFISQQSPE